MATAAQKLKLMYLAKLLESETDDEHGLTGPQIIQRLAELGIAVERKTLYRDLDCLREFGYNIVKYQRSPIEYGLASREFQESELLLLADAVQSSRFLTERKSNALVKAIGKLGSKYLADVGVVSVHLCGAASAFTLTDGAAIDGYVVARCYRNYVVVQKAANAALGARNGYLVAV